MHRANVTYPSLNPFVYNLLCSCDESLPPTNSIQAARLESTVFCSRDILHHLSRSCHIHDSPPSSSPCTACPSQLIFSHHIYDNELKGERCDIQVDVTMRRADVAYPSPHPVTYNLLCSCDEPLPPTNSIQAALLESAVFRLRDILHHPSRSCHIHDSPPSSSPRTACPSQLIFSHHIYDNSYEGIVGIKRL